MILIIDTETSGLDPEKCSILSIGATTLDGEHKFYKECRAWDGAEVHPKALEVNGLHSHQKAKLSESDLMIEFADWLDEVGIKQMAGYNVQFDYGFLDHAFKRAKLKNPIQRRTVDAQSLAWGYIVKNDLQMPRALSMNNVLELLGYSKEPDPHNALTGAECCAKVIRKAIR